MAGARMVASYGFGMVHDNMGLMNVVTSYVGKVSITATADRDMMPDPAFYAQCIQDSLDELHNGRRHNPARAKPTRRGSTRNKAKVT